MPRKFNDYKDDFLNKDKYKVTTNGFEDIVKEIKESKLYEKNGYTESLIAVLASHSLICCNGKLLEKEQYKISKDIFYSLNNIRDINLSDRIVIVSSLLGIFLMEELKNNKFVEDVVKNNVELETEEDFSFFFNNVTRKNMDVVNYVLNQKIGESLINNINLPENILDKILKNKEDKEKEKNKDNKSSDILDEYVKLIKRNHLKLEEIQYGFNEEEIVYILRELNK